MNRLRVLVFAGAAATMVLPAGAQQVPVRELGPPQWQSRVGFTKVIAVRELEEGLLVADQVEGLRFLRWEASRSEEVGRRGDGPGEYRGVGLLFPLQGDSTLFVDAYTGRWLLLSGPEIVATVPEHRPINSVLRHQVVGADRHGSVLAGRFYRIPDRPGRGGAPDSILVIRGVRASESVDTLARIDGGADGHDKLIPTPNHGPTWVIPGNLLRDRDRAVMLHDGWVALALADPYRVDWRMPDGTWVRGSPIATPQVRVGREEQCAAWKRLFGTTNRTCDPGVIGGWPEFLPPFLPEGRVLFGTPDGNLLVVRSPRVDRQFERLDIVGRDGRLVAVLHLEEGDQVVGTGPRGIYTLKTDEFGLQTLHQHAWPNRP